MQEAQEAVADILFCQAQVVKNQNKFAEAAQLFIQVLKIMKQHKLDLSDEQNIVNMLLAVQYEESDEVVASRTFKSWT